MTNEQTNYEKFQKAAHPKTVNTLKNYPSIKGYDFENGFKSKEFFESFLSTGFQATELGKAIHVAKEMINSKVTIYLSFTGNVISSGLHDIIRYLVKHNKVHVIITTASGVEEDVIKSMTDFKMGDFEVQGRQLFENGIGRIGNIFVPSDRYLIFERFINPLFVEMNDEQQKRGKPFTPVEITKLIGERLNEKSYLYWAAKKGISVYCPGIMDGSFGDLVYFFKKKRPGFHIDVTEEYKRLVDYTLQQDKTGVISLGGGIAKHYGLNAQIFREGADYSVYLTTAQEFDGSDSGGNQEEAKTWAKVKVNALTAKVKADFTITFPILVAAVFLEKP